MRKVDFDAGQQIIFFVEGAFFGKVLVCLWGKITFGFCIIKKIISLQ